MRFGGLTVAYTEKYLDWQLGEAHPINPLRAHVVLEKLRELYGTKSSIDVLSNWANASAVERRRWVVAAKGVQGNEAEHLVDAAGGLESVELTMFGGTYVLVEELIRDRAFEKKYAVYFNPAGGELTGAHPDVEVLNDLAYAAARLADAGLRVGYLDWDAHKPAQTEQLLEGRARVLVASIHAPGPGGSSDSSSEALNLEVEPGSEPGLDDLGLVEGVRAALQQFSLGDLDVLVLNAGADGLEDDYSTELAYSLEGMAAASVLVGRYAASRNCSVLVGGGGGFDPLDATPDAWTTVLSTILSQMMFEEEGAFNASNAGSTEDARTALDNQGL